VEDTEICTIDLIDRHKIKGSSFSKYDTAFNNIDYNCHLYQAYHCRDLMNINDVPVGQRTAMHCGLSSPTKRRPEYAIGDIGFWSLQNYYLYFLR